MAKTTATEANTSLEEVFKNDSVLIRLNETKNNLNLKKRGKLSRSDRREIDHKLWMTSKQIGRRKKELKKEIKPSLAPTTSISGIYASVSAAVSQTQAQLSGPF